MVDVGFNLFAFSPHTPKEFEEEMRER